MPELPEAGLDLVVGGGQAGVRQPHLARTGEHLRRTRVEIAIEMLVLAPNHVLDLRVGYLVVHESRPVGVDLSCLVLDARPVFLGVFRRPLLGLRIGVRRAPPLLRLVCILRPMLLQNTLIERIKHVLCVHRFSFTHAFEAVIDLC